MIIEVKNVHHRNRGAELMLAAIRQELGAITPVRPSIALSPHSWPYSQRLDWRAYTKLGSVRFRIDWSFLGRLLPARFKEQFGVVGDRDISAVLDASGYAYGDRWSPAMLRHAARQAAYMKRQGRPYILMPQAFGPFAKRELRAPMKKLLANATLVYARDQTSLKHVVELGVNDASISLCPDFTNMVQPKPHGFGKSTAIVIPNIKMIPGGISELNNSEYFKRLTDGVRQAMGRYGQVLIINHAGPEDLLICKRLHAESGGGNVVVIEQMEGVEIKAYIGGSDLVICSRYHGCVSALSQNVPVIATSWSHKYEELYREFQVPELLMSSGDSYGEKIKYIVGNADAIKSKMRARNALAKSEVELMWCAIKKQLTKTALNVTGERFK